MNRLVAVETKQNIFNKYVDTPIGKLLEYHNLNAVFDKYDKAQLLIGVCMDNRISLRLPEKFAFIIRTGGVNLRFNEFQVSFAIAIGKVKHIALICHDKCGMVNLFSKRDEFINGLVENAGWEREWAEQHFMHFAPIFEIGNEIDFLLNETKRLRLRYPKITIAPLFYKLDDNKLYLISED